MLSIIYGDTFQNKTQVTEDCPELFKWKNGQLCSVDHGIFVCPGGLEQMKHYVIEMIIITYIIYKVLTI